MAATCLCIPIAPKRHLIIALPNGPLFNNNIFDHTPKFILSPVYSKSLIRCPPEPEETIPTKRFLPSAKSSGEKVTSTI